MPAKKDAVDVGKYGFRHDPLKWAANSRSLDAALVRKLILNKPKAGDDALIEARVKKVLAEQKKKGEPEPMALLELGCSPDRPEVKQAVEAACRAQLTKSRDGYLGGGVLQAAFLAGWQDGEEPARSARYRAEHPGRPLKDWHPWQTSGALRSLSAARDVAGVNAGISWWMELLWEKTNAAGCWNKMDPWDMLDGISHVDHPLAAKLVARYVPMILRSQGADGSWAGNSMTVFRALARHGLLDTLRALPPLPVDWRIVREIPAPAGDLWTMTWDGERLWVLDRKKKEAIALRPKDGKVVKRLKVPLKGPGAMGGIGWFDDLLVVAAGGTEHHGGQSYLMLLDPTDGSIKKDLPINAQWGPGGSAQIGRQLWIAQGCWICIAEPDTKTSRKPERLLYGSWPIDIAAEGNAIWHTDEWAPFLFKSDLKDNLIAFLDQPFFESLREQPPTRGIAFDGKNLWALDNENKRICIVEKTESGRTTVGPLSTNRSDSMRKLDLTYGDRWATHMGCLEAGLKHLKIDITPGWLYGGTGHAFVMCIGDDLCPSGPHCWGQGPLHRLSANLGYEITGVAGPKATPDLLAKARKFVKESVDQGYPCYGWHWEWVLITGYDDEGYFYSGRTDPPKDWRKFGAEAIGFLELYSIRPREKPDDAKAVKEALAFAVAFSKTPEKWTLKGYKGGLGAYDNWIEALESVSKGREISHEGAAYHAAVWAECRGLVPAFLIEANKRTGKAHESLFKEAIGHYTTVAERLAEVRDLFPAVEGDEQQMKDNLADADRRQKAIQALKAARKAESAGLASIAKIVEAMD